MSKSHEKSKSVERRVCRELSKVYCGIFQDLAYAYPALEVWFAKDQARLRKIVERRGIRTFTVDLPALGKHLDQALASRAYRCLGLPLQGRGPGHVQMPQFLRELYLRVFNDDGSLKEDCDVVAIAWLRQVLYGAKRARVQCSDAAVCEEVRSFIEVDASLPIPDSFWTEETSSDDSIAATYGGFAKSAAYEQKVQELPAKKREAAHDFLLNLDIVSRFMTLTLGPYRYGEWEFRHGPGVISTYRPDTGKNKYSWCAWSDWLESEFPISECGYHNYLSWVDDCQKAMGQGVSANILRAQIYPCAKLMAVPKTFLKPRLIAAEPGENQWCQQNVKHYFYSRVKSSWIGDFVRFTDQSLNQELCKRGSLDGSLATVDLSAASDRVTCHAVGQLFRSNLGLLKALRATRTRVVMVGSRLSGGATTSVELRKFSTMGSACTFPVESLMFLAVALSAVLTRRQLSPCEASIKDLVGSVAVFGDDIIVPVDCRELLEWGLEALSFKINAAKTFWTGLFRESCGVDAYAGTDVTPAYYTSPYDSSKPETLASAVEVSNNFYAKFLVRTSNVVASTILARHRKVLPLVPMSSGRLGLHSFLRPSPGTRADGKALLKRYNRRLQKEEWQVVTLSGVSLRTPTNDNTALLQYFTEKPSPESRWTHGVSLRPKLKEKLGYLGVEGWA